MLQAVNGKVMLNDKVYSFGKKSVQIYIPAFSTLYFTLGSIWGLPAVTQVVGTCAAVAAFFGVCLGISSANYDSSGAAHDGKMIVTEAADGTTKAVMDLGEKNPADLINQDSVSFKVVHGSSLTEGNPPSDSP